MDRTLNERETIVTIAEYYTAVKEACLTKSAGGDDPSSYPRMAKAWHDGTFAEFDWCLGTMHNQGRQHAYMGESWRTLRAHIVMWWISVDRVQRSATERVEVGKGKKRKTMLVPRTWIEIRRHKDAREQKAQWGIDVVQLIWPRQIREPWLPGEVHETAVDNKIAA